MQAPCFRYTMTVFFKACTWQEPIEHIGLFVKFFAKPLPKEKKI